MVMSEARLAALRRLRRGSPFAPAAPQDLLERTEVEGHGVVVVVSKPIRQPLGAGRCERVALRIHLTRVEGEQLLELPGGDVRIPVLRGPAQLGQGRLPTGGVGMIEGPAREERWRDPRRGSGGHVARTAASRISSGSDVPPPA